MKIGYQGDIGSNCEKMAKEFNKDAELIPLITPQRVVDALEAKEIDYGVLAYKNSTAGVVLDTVNALKGKNYKTVDEKDLLINHSIYMSPEAEKKDIKIIYGHIQALNQCKVYLRNKFLDVEFKVADDGATIAKELSEGKYGKEVAVVCPKGTGELFNLTLIKDNIEDKEDNKTKFIVIQMD
jgi:prephenate dehydratase